MDAAFSRTESPLFISAADLARVLTPQACRDALGRAYADLAVDPGCAAQSLSFPLAAGGIHVKAALAPKTRDCFAAKINVNLPDNPARGLPTIQGLIVLVDAQQGTPLAVLDSPELTARRTAAATAYAAAHGARRDARIAAVCGCGKQAGYQVQALAGVLPGIREWRLHDQAGTRAAALAAVLQEQHGIAATACAALEDTLHGADVIVGCTSTATPYLTPANLRPGCFVAGVGADSPAKNEIAAAVFATARIIVDDLKQCAEYGDLAHALKAKTVTLGAVHATLAQLAAGSAQGRRDEREIVIFDSTGSGLQDLAAARAAYQAALAQGIGLRMG